VHYIHINNYCQINNVKYTTYSNLLGLVIQELREKQGLSQQELAEKLNVTRVTVSKIENGQSEITTPIYLKLRSIFGEQDIFYLTDQRKRILEKQGIIVYDTAADLPKDKKDITGLKFIAGAATLAAILMLFNDNKD